MSTWDNVDFKAVNDPGSPGRFLLSWKCADKDLWREVLDAVKALKGRVFNAKKRAWSIPESTVKDAEKLGFVIDTKDCPTLEPQKKLVVPEKNLDQIELNQEHVHPSAYDYQVDFLRFMVQCGGRGLLADDMGTGKTLQSLMWAMYTNAYPCLMVVLAPTKYQWEKAWKLWHGKMNHPQKNRIQVLEGRTPHPLNPNMNYIINWDILCDWSGFIRTTGHFVPDQPLSAYPFEYVIGDEIQKIGNPKAKMTKAFRYLGKKASDLVALSGTPINKRPKQFWSLLNLLDREQFPQYLKFLNRYCDPKPNGFGMDYDGATNLEELFYKVQPLMLRRLKADVMKDLPPKTIEVVPLEADKAALKKYQEAEQELLDGSEDMNLEQKRRMVAGLMRSAFITKEKACIKWIEDFLEVGGGKFLVFCWHKNVVEILMETLKKYKPAQIDGSITGKKRDAQIQKFRTDPKCRLCISNIQAGGTGVDGLQDCCSHVGFVEFSDIPTHHPQAEDRLHRGGQIMPVTAYYFVAKGTVDEDAIEILDRERANIARILDGEIADDLDMLVEILYRRGLG